MSKNDKINIDTLVETLNAVSEIQKFSKDSVVTDAEEKINYLMPDVTNLYNEINPHMITSRAGVVYFNTSELYNDNAYPYELTDLMKEASPTHTACINLRVDLTTGNGLTPVKENDLLTIQFLSHINKVGDNIQKIWSKIAYDYEVHGMYALQIIYNREGRIAEVYHVDVSTVRAEVNTDEDFIPYTKHWLLSNKWQKITNKSNFNLKNSSVRIANFNPDKWSEDGGRQLLVSKKYQSGGDIYGIPHYNSVINYIKLDYELSKFHLNKVAGGFFPNVIVQLAGNPSDEEKREFKNKFMRRYIGSNKEKLLFVWNEGDDVEPKIIPFNTNDDSDVFEILDRIVTQKILTAHQIIPDLASLPAQGQSLGGDANKLNVGRAYTIETVIKPEQKNMLIDLNKIFIHNALSKVTVTNETLKLTPDDVDNSDTNSAATE
jgi:capsid portal protein